MATPRKMAFASLAAAGLTFPVLWLAIRAYFGELGVLPYWHRPFIWQFFPRALLPLVIVLLFVFVLAVAAVVLGGVAIARRERGAAKGTVWLSLTGMVLGSVCLGALALGATAFYNKMRHSLDSVVCSQNLKQIELALDEHLHENRGVYPSLSPQPGVLMFAEEAIPLRLIQRPYTFSCPATRFAEFQANAVQGPTDVDDGSYYYLGYALLDDDDVEAFAKAYRARVAEGGTFEEDLTVEDGDGTRVLHRLAEGVDLRWQETGDPNAISPHTGREAIYQVPGVVTTDIPILIEQGAVHRSVDWDGQSRGGYVLYLYLGVQYVEYGTWPFTEKTQRILAELAE